MDLLSSGAPEMKKFGVYRVYAAAVMGCALIFAAGIAAYAFYATRALDNVISVTGSAKADATADTVKWTIDIERKVYESNLPSGYPLLVRDLAVVEGFLKNHGIPDDAVTVSQVFPEEIYNYNNQGGPVQYNLRQEITVSSKDVTAIDELTKSVTELAQQGIFMSQNRAEYYISNLPDLRVSLLGDAIKDAKARAEEIAKAGGQSVGSLRSASSGVVQVLAPDSIDISDYGQYDTQSIKKEVMVTARASFSVR